MKKMISHAGSAFKCTDGKYLVFSTLCNLNAYASSIVLAVSPDTVDCKRCLKSLAWESYLENVKARSS